MAGWVLPPVRVWDRAGFGSEELGAEVPEGVARSRGTCIWEMLSRWAACVGVIPRLDRRA